MKAITSASASSIIVGFLGGLKRAHGTSLADLKVRRAYKWDHATNIWGKIIENWISREVFLAEVKAKTDAGR